MKTAFKLGFNDPSRPATPAESPWRVLSLLNVFRLLVPMLLLVVFFFDSPSTTVGSVHSGLFIGVTVAYFAFGLVCIQTIQSRTPPAEWQALVQLIVDAIMFAILIHASGGITSGLATLLVLPTGGCAMILSRRFALLGTSIVTLSLSSESDRRFRGRGAVAGWSLRRSRTARAHRPGACIRRGR